MMTTEERLGIERLPSPISTSSPALPTAPEAEQALIGCCVYGGSKIVLEVADTISDAVFFDEAFRDAFSMMSEMAGRGIDVDLVSLAVEYKRQHNKPLPHRVLMSPDAMASPIGWPYFREIVVETFEKRAVMQQARDALTEALDPMATAQEVRAKINEATLDTSNEYTLSHGKLLAEENLNGLQYLYENQGKLPGLSTGFKELDEMTGGLVAGEYSVIAARPSEGKSALGMALVHHVAFNLRKPVLFISLEMPLRSVTARFTAMEERIDYTKIRRGSFDEAAFKKVQNFSLKLKERPLYIIDGTAMTCDTIARAIRRSVKTFGIQLVVVDYLQKVRPVKKSDKRTEQIAEISDALKNAAKSNNVHVCGLAQVNRESAKDNRAPKVHEIADSDAIERDADLILMIHRPKDEAGIRDSSAGLAIAKQREGETGLLNIQFTAPYIRFEDPCLIHPEDIP